MNVKKEIEKIVELYNNNGTTTQMVKKLRELLKKIPDSASGNLTVAEFVAQMGEAHEDVDNPNERLVNVCVVDHREITLEEYNVEEVYVDEGNGEFYIKVGAKEEEEED